MYILTYMNLTKLKKIEINESVFSQKLYLEQIQHILKNFYSGLTLIFIFMKGF